MMEFDEDGVTLRTERGERKWQWPHFSKFVESPYFFHLYFDPRSFFLVPIDAFKDIADKQEIRNLLKSNIRH
jgi:hypothetical protein